MRNCTVNKLVAFKIVPEKIPVMLKPLPVHTYLKCC